MPALQTLTTYLTTWAQGTGRRSEISKVVLALAGASIKTAEVVAAGLLENNLTRVVARAGLFDEQKEIDVLANQLIADVLQDSPVAALASEELVDPLELDWSKPYLVAVDPLDGSSNVGANVSFGMIFSVLPKRTASLGAEAFLIPGTSQIAAGFVVYGPQTVLVLTVGSGTKIFTLDRSIGEYRLTHPIVAVPPNTTEYAINSSNARFWDDPIRIYMHDCENGANGPRGQDFNMRWTGSPVADIYRILIRGGIYLYPGDRRPGFEDGRIRLIYEANPFAWIVEDAGGIATTGMRRILDIVPSSLHQRTALITGSRREVDCIMRLYNGLDLRGERSPLFGRRGLFRA